MNLNIQTRGMPRGRGRECNSDNERGACTASSEMCVEILNFGQRATIAAVRNISQQPESRGAGGVPLTHASACDYLELSLISSRQRATLWTDTNLENQSIP